MPPMPPGVGGVAVKRSSLTAVVPKLIRLTNQRDHLDIIFSHIYVCIIKDILCITFDFMIGIRQRPFLSPKSLERSRTFPRK
jgi:hypothetical protein